MPKHIYGDLGTAGSRCLIIGDRGNDDRVVIETAHKRTVGEARAAELRESEIEGYVTITVEDGNQHLAAGDRRLANARCPS